MVMRMPACLFLCLAALGLSGFGPNEPPIERLDPEIQGEQAGEPGILPPGSTAHAIRSAMNEGRLEGWLSGYTEGIRDAAERAYAIRIFDPIWTREGADALLSAFDRANSVGIRVAPSLRTRVEQARSQIGASQSEEAAEADLVLTAAFLAYADTRINGVADPNRVADPMAGKVNPEELELWLAEAGEARFDFTALDPGHAAFGRLREIAARYRGYADEGGWEDLPAADGLVETGERDPMIADLRERLAAEGYDVPEAPVRRVENEAGETREEADTTLFTEALSDVLKEFQHDRGLKEDGIVGPRTLDALNRDPADLVDKVEANMERWRWAPERFPERFIRINIPAYRARAYENGEVAVEMKAIIGLANRKTPLVMESIEYLVANPRWYVPESILERDKLDDIRSDPDYIESHDYYVLDRETGERVDDDKIDWSDPDVEEQYRLVQRSGEENALGELKFMFPNEYSIYLHGTPAQHLFRENLRTFSSGCIRIIRPLDMSDWIARHDPGLTPEEVRSAVAGEELQRLPLENPLPVYTVYFSVERGEDGEALFHPDVYGWDEETIAALENNPVAFAPQAEPEGGAQ